MSVNRFFFLGALALTPLMAVAGAEKVVNRPMVTVNGEIVLLSEFEKNWATYLNNQKNLIPDDQKTDAWKQESRHKLLDQMVDDTILLQEAKKKNIRPNQRDLETGRLQVKARFLPESAQRDLQTLLQRQTAGKGDAPGPGDVDFGRAWAELAKTNAKAVKQADSGFTAELDKEGLSLKDFETRIKDQLSVTQFVQKEIAVRAGPASDAQVKELYDRVVKAMKGQAPAGLDEEHTADIESMARYLARQTGERVRARHILVKFPDRPTAAAKAKALVKIKDVQAQLAKGADFAELAAEKSDDAPTAKKGGDLGIFSHGQMVPPFEKAAFALTVGQVSGVVETEYGYHLIRVEEKHAPTKLRFEDVEPDLREYLRRARQEEVYNDMVKDLRKNAKISVLVNPEELPKDPA
jgi:parvulin-like peptidyl-prolyl isomerase